MTRLETLVNQLQSSLGPLVRSIRVELGEVNIEIDGKNHLEVATRLRDDPALRFEQAMDLCGLDLQAYRNAWDGPRFAVVLHLLSLTNNWRVRVRSYCTDEDFPVIASLNEVWPSLSWFEREAFDLYGIVFEGHPDLRRILTDYGFVGHPFRKDFPVSGYVEMRYDPEQKRVIYQPVTIEPRENTPRIIREEGYGGGR